MLDLFGEDKRMKHFLKLHYAIRILVNLNERSISEINIAKDILRKFVSESADIYGRRFLSYNTHGLLHLTNDARNFGSLDHFSLVILISRHFLFLEKDQYNFANS